MDFVDAVKEGLNEVAIEEVDAGYILTLTHNATTDNAITCFVLKSDVVCWADYEDDEAFEEAVNKLGIYEDQYEKALEMLKEQGSAGRGLAEALQENLSTRNNDNIWYVDSMSPSATEFPSFTANTTPINIEFDVVHDPQFDEEQF